MRFRAAASSCIAAATFRSRSRRAVRATSHSVWLTTGGRARFASVVSMPVAYPDCGGTQTIQEPRGTFLNAGPSERDVLEGAQACALREAALLRGAASGAELRTWAAPGSNGRPPACKARAAAAIYCRLSLRPPGERWLARGCCVLLRLAASEAPPDEHFNFGNSLPSREAAASCRWPGGPLGRLGVAPRMSRGHLRS